MDRIWREMGFIHWPLAFSILAVAALTLWSMFRLFQPGARGDLRTKAWLDSILFWGGFGLVSGVLGTLVGMILAAQAIEGMGSVSASLVWGGFRVAMLSSAAGTLILALAALIWYVLQLRWRLLSAAAAEREAHA